MVFFYLFTLIASMISKHECISRSKFWSNGPVRSRADEGAYAQLDIDVGNIKKLKVSISNGPLLSNRM